MDLSSRMQGAPAGAVARNRTKIGSLPVGKVNAMQVMPEKLRDCSRTKIGLERVQQKWSPVLRPDTRQNNHIEQDDESKNFILL